MTHPKHHSGVVGMLALLALTACEMSAHNRIESVRDKTVMRQVFNECMSVVPEAPKRTHYSDWDEVIDECRSYADLIARYCLGSDEDCQEMGYERSGKLIGSDLPNKPTNEEN